MILATIALLVIGSSLNAQPRNGNRMCMKQGQKSGFDNHKNGFGDRNGPRFERMQKMLNLTDEQSAKISDMKFEHEKMVLDSKNEIAQKKLVVRKMMTSNKIDQEELLKITKEKSDLQGKIKLSKTTMWLEVYNILDDIQKEKWTNTFGHFGKHGNCKDFHKQARGGFGNDDCNRRNPQKRMR
jgi:Spy/CpxP family protein refolding chaperone